MSRNTSTISDNSEQLIKAIKKAVKQFPYNTMPEQVSTLLSSLNTALLPKQIYKKFSIVCHPDKYNADEKQSKAANDLFQDIKALYEKNNKSSNNTASKDQAVDGDDAAAHEEAKKGDDSSRPRTWEAGLQPETEPEITPKINSAKTFVKFIVPTIDALKILENFLEDVANLHNIYFPLYNKSLKNTQDDAAHRMVAWHMLVANFNPKDCDAKQEDIVDIDCATKAGKIAIRAWLKASGCPFTEPHHIRINVYQFLIHLGTLLLRIGIDPNKLYQEKILPQVNTFGNVKQHIVSWIKAWHAQKNATPAKDTDSAIAGIEDLIAFFATCNDVLSFKNALATIILTGGARSLILLNEFNTTSLRYHIACACELIDPNTENPEKDLLQLIKLPKNQLLEKIFSDIIIDTTHSHQTKETEVKEEKTDNSLNAAISDLPLTDRNMLTNYFTAWENTDYEGASQKIINLYSFFVDHKDASLQAHDEWLRKEFILPPDDMPKISTYTVNRIFLHALRVPQTAWTERFTWVFKKVLRGVQCNFTDRKWHADARLATAYPSPLLNLLAQVSTIAGDNKQTEIVATSFEEYLYGYKTVEMSKAIPRFSAALQEKFFSRVRGKYLPQMFQRIDNIVHIGDSPLIATSLFHLVQSVHESVQVLMINKLEPRLLQSMIEKYDWEHRRGIVDHPATQRNITCTFATLATTSHPSIRTTRDNKTYRD